MAQRKITQARAHETRSRILTGAAEAFAEHGFAGATIADIMTRSGVTKRALYFHFDTKEEVADAVLAAHTTWLRDAVAALAGSPVQRLVDYGYLTCDGLADDPIFQATARLAIERETYGAGRPASFGVWQETTRDMLDEVAAAGASMPGATRASWRACSVRPSSGCTCQHARAIRRRACTPRSNSSGHTPGRPS